MRRYLDKARHRKPVYIITGLKTVTGEKAKSYISRSIGGMLDIEVDGTIWSGGTVPIGGGPGIEGKAARKEGTSWQGSSDFVFAFRVRKIKVQKTGTLEGDEDYKEGAMLEDEVKDTSIATLRVSTVEDPTAEDEGCKVEELVEGDSTIACAIPNIDDDEVEQTRQ